MEEALTSYNDLLCELIHEATQSGVNREPSNLLSATRALANPMQTLCGIDEGNNLFATLREETPSLQMLLIVSQSRGQRSLCAEERIALVELIRWALGMLRQWSDSTDPRRAILAAAFVVFQTFRIEGIAWHEFPRDISNNSTLGDALERLLSGIAIEVKADNRVPVWEQELIKSFLEADQRRNWIVIERDLHRLERVTYPSIVQLQTVRLLYHLWFDKLLKAIEGLSGSIMASQLAGCLSPEERLHVAASSDNPYIDFGFVLYTVRHQPRREELNPQAQTHLSQILLKASKDEVQWVVWMESLNRYPLRYPALHVSLGRVLASVSDSEIRAYIDAIDMTAIPIEANNFDATGLNQTRICITQCLQEFRQLASLERRKLLWQCAYQKWRDWRFGKDGDQAVFGIQWSPLDFAIVGHAIECISDIERDEILETLLARLRNLRNEWYASTTECISEWNRLRSAFQPLFHAKEIRGKTDEWLNVEKIYLPLDEAKNPYLKLMYG